MISEQSARIHIAAAPERVRTALLEPLSLPEWNSAFLGIVGRPDAVVGETYRLTVRPGMTGTLTYTTIESDRIAMRWSVPGFTEFGHWSIRPRDGGTEVEHSFGHRGPLAAALAPAYRGVARLRLTRLADRLAGPRIADSTRR